MDKMREDFEAFYESYMLGEGRRIEYIKNEIASFKPERNKYGYSDAQEFWVVWQASRAALRVELPSFENGSIRGYSGDCEEARMVVDCVAESLEKAGVSYE